MNTLMRNMGYPHAKDRPDIVNGHDDVLEDDQFSLCCLCGKSFPTMRSLHIHINISHEGWFICLLCTIICHLLLAQA
ncbi:hypothetical protein P879_03864 [Paragonimus westermani]|uniref:C2H2-type domain-containing protein n=1 Tax=Paragonimus westermani TaxID=34504 RepID=A0A8T0DW91_9TREM|nr:hypothetical protein P879_03864 [Paragonimus westermani]